MITTTALYIETFYTIRTLRLNNSSIIYKQEQKSMFTFFILPQHISRLFGIYIDRNVKLHTNYLFSISVSHDQFFVSHFISILRPH